VLASSPNTESQHGKTCYRCGNSGHAPFNCKYKSYKCNFCKKTGHLVAVCREKSKSQGQTNYVGESVNESQVSNNSQNVNESQVSNNSQNINVNENANVHFSEHDCPCNMHDLDTLGLYHVGHDDAKKSSQPVMVQLTIASTPVQMEVDTGSAKTIIPENLYRDKFEHVT
jgi:hypothetical protein